LPLTLAIADALIVEVDQQKYAIPQATVREIVRIEPGTPTVLENNELLRHRDGVVPLSRLSSVFATGPTNPNAVYALIVGEGQHSVGLVVDRVIGLREIVVRPLTDQLAQSPGVSGATELGDGRVVLILDSASLSRTARQRGRAATEAMASSSARSQHENSK
jgi:two-component system chemotaxis sensor kinase CheA